MGHSIIRSIVEEKQLGPILGALIFTGVIVLVAVATHLICWGFVHRDIKRSRSFERKVRDKNNIDKDVTIIWREGLGGLAITWLVDFSYMVFIVAMWLVFLIHPRDYDLDGLVTSALSISGILSSIAIAGILAFVFIEARGSIQLVDENGIGLYGNFFGKLYPRRHIAWGDVEEVTGNGTSSSLPYIRVASHQTIINTSGDSNGLDVLLNTIGKKLPEDCIGERVKYNVDFYTRFPPSLRRQ